MGLFDWLLVGHLVGDYILQTRWMAEKKVKQILPLIIHSMVYTTTIALFALLAKGLSWWGICLIFISHVILDQRAFIDYWAVKVNGNANIDWLKITLDQSWHILILAVATLLK
jgi:hypothetical protein